MEREYQRPEVEMITFVTEEVVLSNDSVDGEMGVESNTLFG